jgi:hypothetical protein
LSPTARLAEIITQTILPEAWEVNGGYGNVLPLNGILIVRADGATMMKVEDLIEELRRAVQ